MNLKKIFLILGIVLLIIIIGIFVFFNYKKINFGNNMSNKSIEEMEQYILNISSYEAKIEVTVTSNKNENKYKMTQKYADNCYKQEVEEPSNISGMQTILSDNKLEIKNTKLGATTVLDNFPCIAENSLWLTSFINDYKNSSNKSIKEKDELWVMEVNVQNSSKYLSSKTLYIDKKTGKPTKLCINDENNKTLIYILYNEINFDSISKDEVVAFNIPNLFI